MRSIFEPLQTGWDSLTGCVHVYALPGWDASVVRPWQDAIERSGVCEVQPVEFLHATVARTPLFLRPGDTGQQPALEQLAAELTSIAVDRRSRSRCADPR